jgi:hypothetical protein
MFRRNMISCVSWRGALVALLLPFQPALAQEVVIGTEVACDSGEQAQRYATLFRGNAEETLTKVNTEAESDDACKLVSVAYLRGKDVAKTTTNEGTFVTARILIVGYVMRKGVVNAPPFVQFMVFKIDERMA